MSKKTGHVDRIIDLVLEERSQLGSPSEHDRQILNGLDYAHTFLERAKKEFYEKSKVSAK